MKKNSHLLFTLLIFLITTILLFLPFFTKSLYPFPGDFLVAWFEPWRSTFNESSFIQISHKPIADDIFRQLYPFKILAASMVQRLEFPLWNPYNGAGMPLLATMHVGFLNPFNTLFLIFPRELAWSIFIILQPFLIGFFMYLFARKTGMLHLSSLFASLTFTLSSFVVTRTIYGDYDYGLVGFLLILYGVECFAQKRNRRWLIIPFAVFLIISSTQPQIIFYLLVFSFLYGVIRMKKEKIKKDMLYFPLLFLLGIGLTSIQLLPTLELIQHANINTQSSVFIMDRFLLPIQHFISFFIPNYFGNQSTYNYWGSADYIETVTAIGIIPVFFAFLAWANPSFGKNLKKFYLLSILIPFVLVLDSPLTRFVYSLPVPILSTSIPSRVLVLALFSISILGGMGFDAWIKKKINLKEIILKTTPLLIVIAGITLGTIVFFMQDISCNNSQVLDCRKIALRNTGFELLTFMIFLLACIFSFLMKKGKTLIFSAYLTIFLIILLGIYNGHKFLPFTQKERILPEVSILQTIKKLGDTNRSFGFEEANIKTNFASYFLFYDPNYYDPLYIKRYGELVEYGNNENINNLKRSDVEVANDLLINKEKESRRTRLLSLLSVKLLLFNNNDVKKEQISNILYKDQKWTIVNNTGSLSRAYFVSNTETLSNENAILKRLFEESFHHTQTAIIEEYLAEEIKESQSQQKANIIQHSENKISIETITSRPSFLVLTDNYYPGWRAYVDSIETKIYRTNYTFRGIVVPEGSHTVTFSYFPSSVRLGIILSLISLMIYLFLVFKVSYFSSSGQK